MCCRKIPPPVYLKREVHLRRERKSWTSLKKPVESVEGLSHSRLSEQSTGSVHHSNGQNLPFGGGQFEPTRISLVHRIISNLNSGKMESQINVRQSMLDKMKRPFKNNRRLNRYWNSVQLNLSRNSGYYALVSSLMCLCLIGLRSNTEFHDHDEIDSELHYSFHSWEPKVCLKQFNDLSFGVLG